jgi:hypothetical protein
MVVTRELGHIASDIALSRSKYDEATLWVTVVDNPTGRSDKAHYLQPGRFARL